MKIPNFDDLIQGFRKELRRTEIIDGKNEVEITEGDYTLVVQFDCDINSHTVTGGSDEYGNYEYLEETTRRIYNKEVKLFNEVEIEMTSDEHNDILKLKPIL